MENERDPEVIRKQMQQTRDHLTEKVEAVENIVTNTVKGTADAVSETVSEVKEVVSDTVEGVKEVVSDTVEGVKNFFDIRAHVESHPWLMFFGAAGLGFLTTKLTMGAGSRSESDEEWDRSRRSYTSVGTYCEAQAHIAAAAPPERREEESHGLMSGLLAKLGPSADKLKEMGLGYTMAVIDKLLTGSLPQEWRGGVHDMIDTLTTSLGGKPMKEWKSSDAQCGSAAYHPGPTTQY